MKLTLRNFRCYKNETSIDVAQGVTLIKGQSGSGKTTIIEAIVYALYGKIRSPYTIGEKSCSVKLKVTENFEISRQGGPGRLKLVVNGVKHEGNEAQAAINNVYGSYEFFIASCYLKQGKRSTLFSGSNADKMALIRSISFRDDDVEEIQKKLKDEVKKLENGTKELEYARNSKEDILKTFSEDYEALKMFIKTNPEIDFTTLDIDELIEKSKKKDVEISSLRSELEEVIKLETMVKTLQEKVGEPQDISGFETRINEIDEKIKENKARIGEINTTKAKKQASEKLSALRKKKEEILFSLKTKQTELTEKLGIDDSQKGYEEAEKILNRLKNNENKNKEINAVLKALQLTDIAHIREKLISYNADSERIKVEIENIEKSIEDIEWNRKQKETLTCPKCSSSLTLREEKLEMLEENFTPVLRVVQRLDATPELLRQKTNDKEKIDMLQEKLKESNSTINRMKRELTKYTQGEEEQIPNYESFISLRDKVKTAQKDIDDISEKDEEIVEIQDNEEELKKENIILEDERRKIQAKIDKEKSEEKTRQELKNTKDTINNRTSSDIKEKIEDNVKAKEYLQILSKMAITYSKNKELTNNFNKAEEEFKRAEENYLSAVKLYEKAKLVEISVLKDTVDSLNLEMEKYLNVLFPDDPISVIFKTTKNLKGKEDEKMTCSLEIFYKNQVYDDVNQLSGGEADRISLAKTLALNSIAASQYLFLDESLNALHATLKVEIVELLKDFCNDDKTCIVVSHEGIEGAYHNVIDLDQINK